MCYYFARRKCMSQFQLKTHQFQILASKNSNSITKRWRRFLKEVEKQNGKKTLDWLRIEQVSRQNKFKSGAFSTLSTCSNKAVVRNHCIIVISWFNKTKGFFCFSFNKRSPQDALRKMTVFFHTRNISKRKQTSGKKNAEFCLRHVNKTASGLKIKKMSGPNLRLVMKIWSQIWKF